MQPTKLGVGTTPRPITVTVSEPETSPLGIVGSPVSTGPPFRETSYGSDGVSSLYQANNITGPSTVPVKTSEDDGALQGFSTTGHSSQPTSVAHTNHLAMFPAFRETSYGSDASTKLSPMTVKVSESDSNQPGLYATSQLSPLSMVPQRSTASGSDAMVSIPSGASSCRGPRTSKASAHPLLEHKRLLSCVRLLDTKHFQALPTPLPRAQDVPDEFFRLPLVGDQVISVSHAWRNQAHPDPSGHKTRALLQLLASVNAENDKARTSFQADGQSVLLFLDFISIPQRPFQSNQKPRTDDELQQFRTALEVMHEMFFFSDRIIHLPWDDCKIAGEGKEWTVAAAELHGAEYFQADNRIQLVALGRPSRDLRAYLTGALGSHRPQLFAEVVSVDEELVTSMHRLETLLRSGARVARLRGHPFGFTNTIPSDERGWVFLERFITMVKCAMMDEETAKKVVITPSETIFRQILEGASLLREASLHDSKNKKAGELKRVLENFTRELQNKHFSPASTDKREISTATSCMQAERDVVCGIMCQFVEHLADHWEAEAARQRSVAYRLRKVVAAATGTFFLERDGFSDEYTARLAGASKFNPGPLALLITLPLVGSLAIVLCPYTGPEEGWASQLVFWAVGAPATCLLSVPGIPTLLAAMIGVRGGANQFFCAIAWSVSTSVVGSCVLLGVARTWDVFPVPFTTYVCLAIAFLTLPLLWWVVPHNQRHSSEFRWKLLCALAGVMSVVMFMGAGFPLLNSAITYVGQGWQVLLVSVYFAAKLAFEILGVGLSRGLGPDAMPYLLVWATLAYQVNLCVVFSKVHSLLVIIELICFSVLENVYHLWSMWRQRDCGTARQEQYIAASIVLRVFMEVVVPSQCLLIYTLLGMFRPEHSDVLCLKGPDGERRTQFYLLLQIAVELAVSCFAYPMLVMRGQMPLFLLQGLISTRLWTLLTTASIALVYFATMQHIHWGMDMSFKLPWVLEDDVRWVCGLKWTIAA